MVKSRGVCLRLHNLKENVACSSSSDVWYSVKLLPVTGLKVLRNFQEPLPFLGGFPLVLPWDMPCYPTQRYSNRDTFCLAKLSKLDQDREIGFKRQETRRRRVEPNLSLKGIPRFATSHQCHSASAVELTEQL